MDKKLLISVIVPVYNVEKYLCKCVDSILKQTYKNLEIILVDDGSPDGSPVICDEYAQKDNRVKVIHKQNGGLSDARNAGIDIATGDYIAFVDSDDYIESNMYEELSSALENEKSDIAVCSVNMHFEKNGKQKICWQHKTAYESKEEFIDELFRPYNLGVVVAWNKLYRRHIFDEIRYPVGKIHEDEFVIYDVLCKADNGVAIVENLLYNYNVRDDSIIRKAPSDKIFDRAEAIECRIDKLGKDSKYYDEAVYQLLNAYYYNCMVSKGYPEFFDKAFEKYKKVYEQAKHLSFKRKLKHFVFRYFKIFSR